MGPLEGVPRQIPFSHLTGRQLFIFLQATNEGREASEKAQEKKNDTAEKTEAAHYLIWLPLG